MGVFCIIGFLVIVATVVVAGLWITGLIKTTNKPFKELITKGWSTWTNK